MTVMRFVDTNILLYAVSTDERERSKRRIALSLLEDRGLAMSVQVLQEFYVQATHARRSHALSHDQAVSLIHAWQRYPIQEMTVELLEKALLAKARWQLPYWDAAIVEAARLSGCRTLLSEDLQHGMRYDTIAVENPFLA